MSHPAAHITAEAELKAEAAHLDNQHAHEHEQDLAAKPGNVPQTVMKSSLDRMSVWQAMRVYKRVVLMAMLAAFSASLDGYQINLNGSIVANLGFIQTFASPENRALAKPVMDAQRVSVWGGMQSTGQFIGQVTLPLASDKFGRKVAFYITWFVLAISVAVESFASDWGTWTAAKLLAGMGVGMVQATLPMYIAELAPTQLRGFLINAYTFWFVVGQLMAPVALQQLNVSHPYDFRVAIYTQWAMIGILMGVFLYIPESPWWLVSHGKTDKARKVLLSHNSQIADYDVEAELGIMHATVDEERRLAHENSEIGFWSIFKGTNGLRLVIAAWPKIMQQFVGLTIFNTYATFFFQIAGAKDPFLVTVILACVQLISCIIFAFTTDSYGRRPLTVYGYCVTTVAVLCLGIIGFFDYSSASLGALLIFFACVAIFSTTGASAIGYAYLAEVPQQQYRARTAGWGLALSNLFAIMFSFVVPIMLKGSTTNWGPKTGLFFAGTGTIVCVIGWFILPELAQRTPAEIDEMFEKRVPPRKFKGYVTEVQMTLDEAERRNGAGVQA